MEFEELLSEISEQRSDDWHKLRLGRFTSSEIHKLMGAKGFGETGNSYIMDKVAEVLTGERKEAFSKAMQWGTDHEPEAREYFASSIEREIKDSVFIPYGDHAGGTPDGETPKEEKNGFGIEIKCPFNSAIHIKHSLIKSESDFKKICTDYYWQVQANMFFSGKDKWHFISYDPRVLNEKYRMSSLLIHANKEDHALLKERLDMAIGEKIKILESL